MSNEDKLRQLKVLGSNRKKESRTDYNNISHYDKRYETEFVSPVTKSSHNVSSSIMVVLQDWASDQALNANFDQETADLGYALSGRWHTFKNLKVFLKETFDKDLGDVFTTNLFPLIKNGNASAGIRQKDLDWAFEKYCWRQIEIVEPKFVVCLGRNTYWTFLKNLQEKPVYEGVGSHFEHSTITIFHQVHPGGQGVNRRGKEQVFKDWKKMREQMQTLK